MQDNRAIQMLSAEIPLKGRSIPVYREIFSSGTLKGRASGFLSKLRGLLAQDSSVIIIMDAGFGEDWLQAIEQQGWDWILRIRKGKNIRLMPEGAWINLKTDFPPIGTRAKSYAQASIMSRHAHACRIVTKKKSEQRTTSGYRKRPSNYHVGNDTYRRAAKEPWILATILSSQDCSTPQIVAYYSKRMQIEESFRDVKRHRYGLGARYAKTTSVERWGVKMLLAAIVQVMLWLIGVLGHSQGFQKTFQVNTVKDKKIFSYFYLGKLIVEHQMLSDITIEHENLSKIIQDELERKW